jgi:hypothetical protein
MMLKGTSPVEAYLYTDGLARFCTVRNYLNFKGKLLKTNNGK